MKHIAKNIYRILYSFGFLINECVVKKYIEEFDWKCFFEGHKNLRTRATEKLFRNLFELRIRYYSLVSRQDRSDVLLSSSSDSLSPSCSL